MSSLTILGGKLGLGYLLSPPTKQNPGFVDVLMLWSIVHAGYHGTTLSFLNKHHSEQAHVASFPQRWHLVIVGVCGGDIFSAVFHVPLELSGQEALSACVINIIYCYISPFWSLWPWQFEIFATLVRAELLCSQKGPGEAYDFCCPGS